MYAGREASRSLKVEKHFLVESCSDLRVCRGISEVCPNQINVSEKYLTVLLIHMLDKMALTFEYIEEILKCVACVADSVKRSFLMIFAKVN